MSQLPPELHLCCHLSLKTLTMQTIVYNICNTIFVYDPVLLNHDDDEQVGMGGNKDVGSGDDDEDGEGSDDDGIEVKEE